MTLPFTCPLDYVLPPSRLDDDPSLFGLMANVREYSFLDQPRAAWLAQVRCSGRCICEEVASLDVTLRSGPRSP